MGSEMCIRDSLQPLPAMFRLEVPSAPPYPPFFPNHEHGYKARCRRLNNKAKSNSEWSTQPSSDGWCHACDSLQLNCSACWLYRRVDNASVTCGNHYVIGTRVEQPVPISTYFLETYCTCPPSTCSLSLRPPFPLLSTADTTSHRGSIWKTRSDPCLPLSTPTRYAPFTTDYSPALWPAWWIHRPFSCT